MGCGTARKVARRVQRICRFYAARAYNGACYIDAFVCERPALGRGLCVGRGCCLQGTVQSTNCKWVTPFSQSLELRRIGHSLTVSLGWNCSTLPVHREHRTYWILAVACNN